MHRDDDLMGDEKTRRDRERQRQENESGSRNPSEGYSGSGGEIPTGERGEDDRDVETDRSSSENERSSGDRR
ncbi:MAG TPA: hypothetical protein VMS56_07270 [Thermoanaerobaculia bacterium]|nr:hypothetical protein [Thermoanaerobaculia bacterium]